MSSTKNVPAHSSCVLALGLNGVGSAVSNRILPILRTWPQNSLTGSEHVARHMSREHIVGVAGVGVPVDGPPCSKSSDELKAQVHARTRARARFVWRA